MVRTYFILFLLIFVAACTQQGGGTFQRTDPYGANVYGDSVMIPVENGTARQNDQDFQWQSGQQKPSTTPSTSHAAILLPLTGTQSAIGQSMLNAAQLAIFDMKLQGFGIIPLDTRSTQGGTANAVAEAATQNAAVILGPLLADNVATAGSAARQYGLQVIGFTTNATKVGGNVMTLGILPFDQGARMADFATSQNLKRVVIITPNDPYANAVVSAFDNAANQKGVQIIDKIMMNGGQDAARIANALSQRRRDFDAIFMPFGNPHISAIANALNQSGLGTSNVAWLGTGIWDAPSISSNQSMRGAFYAAPDPQQRKNFEERYREVYNQAPHRLASLAYDATALAGVILHKNNGRIDRNALMNPNGFSGIDGIFRFQSNGVAERGLAVQRITGQGSEIVAGAPSRF